MELRRIDAHTFLKNFPHTCELYTPYCQYKVYDMFRDKSMEEVFNTIHTLFGGYPKLEIDLVLQYSKAVLVYGVFDKTDLTGNELNIFSRVKTEIRKIGEEHFPALSQFFYFRTPPPCLSSQTCALTWIALEAYHHISSTSKCNIFSSGLHYFQGRLLELVYSIKSKLLKYFCERCLDLQTTPEQSLSFFKMILSKSRESFHTPLELDRLSMQINQELVQHLQSKRSKDMLKSNELKVLIFIMKWWKDKLLLFCRENSLQMKNDLESILTSTDTAHLTEMLMKCIHVIPSRKHQVYIALVTCHFIVTTGKHEQLTVVSKYQDVITDQPEPEIFSFYLETFFPGLNATDKEQWTHKNYSKHLSQVYSMLRDTIYTDLSLGEKLPDQLNRCTTGMQRSRNIFQFKLRCELPQQFIFDSNSMTQNVLDYLNFLLRSNDGNVYEVLNYFNQLESDTDDNIRERILDAIIQLMDMTCHQKHIAKLVLDIKMNQEGEFAKKLMRKLVPFLQIEQNLAMSDILHKCYCIVRHHNKYDHAEGDAISKYREAFPFLKAMEANDKMEKLSTFRTIAVLMILLLISSALGQISSQLKKYLSLKYEYKDAILYLLWCSGDVEINPGPTLKKLRKVPDSQKKRSWIYESCTFLLKLIIGCNLETKTDRLWKEAPGNWPTVQPFYDPRNKPKGGNYTSSSDEKLMENLYECCRLSGKPIPIHFQIEFQAWKCKGSKNDLFELYISRTECNILSEAVKYLTQYKGDKDLKKHLQERNINIILPAQTRPSKPTKHYPDILRDLVTTFCRLSHGCPLTVKSDKIITTHPPHWDPQHYYPCKSKERLNTKQNKELVKNLIAYCEINKIIIPPELVSIVRAWHNEDLEEVCKQYTMWTNVCIIDHSLKYLWIEGYLDTPHVQQCLEKIGINISTAKKQEYLRKHPPKSIEQSKTAIGASSSIVQNDTDTPSTSSYNKGSLNDREVNSVDSSAVKSGLISSACEDVSMVVSDPLDQSAETQERKSVKRKNKITEDKESAKKVATCSVQFVKNPTNVKDDTSTSTVSVLDSPTHTTTSEDDNSKTDNKDSSNIQQINQMVEKTSSNDTDQNNGSPDSANSSPTIHKDSSQDGRLTPKQEPLENSKNKPDESSSGTVIDSLIDTNKCTNIPNDTTTDDMDVDKIQNQLNALNNNLPEEFDADLDTYLNSQNLESSNLDQQDIVFTQLEDDL